MIWKIWKRIVLFTKKIRKGVLLKRIEKTRRLRHLIEENGMEKDLERFDYILRKMEYALLEDHDELYSGYSVVLKKEFGDVKKVLCIEEK
jgi:hypothetical protein